MKKLGVILAALLAVLVLGLPPVLGMLTQSHVNARVATLEGNPFVAARVRAFERGWFSSTAIIELALSPSYLAQLQAHDAFTGDPAAAGAFARGVTMYVALTHGPVAIRDGVHVGLSRMVARPDVSNEGYPQLLERLGIPYLFEFRGRTGFLGAMAFDADAPPVDFVTEDARVRFSGAVLDGSFAGRSLRYDARMDHLEFTSGSGAFALQGMRTVGDNELGLPYVALGTVDVSVEHVSMLDATAAAEPVFDAVNLRFGSRVDLDDSGAMAHGEVSYSADTITAPDLQIRDAQLRLTVRNLDVEALQAYAQATQRAALAGVADPNQLLAEITPAVERLLAADPSIAIDPLRFVVNDEAFDARLQLDTKTDRLPAAGALDLRDPTLWLNLLDGVVTANVSKNLARDFAIQVAILLGASTGDLPPDQIRYMAEAQAGLIIVTLVTMGVLTDGGENYATELRFTDGTLSVNGNPLPIGLP